MRPFESPPTDWPRTLTAGAPGLHCRLAHNPLQAPDHPRFAMMFDASNHPHRLRNSLPDPGFSFLCTGPHPPSTTRTAIFARATGGYRARAIPIIRGHLSSPTILQRSLPTHRNRPDRAIPCSKRLRCVAPVASSSKETLSTSARMTTGSCTRISIRCSCVRPASANSWSVTR